MDTRRLTTAAACLLLLVVSLAAAGCGDDDENPEEPSREGFAIPVGEIDYNVFITRQLNLDIPPDRAYYEGPEPPADSTYYGVFLQACNNTDEPQEAAEDFKVVDNQGNEFEPKELDERNAFAYHPQQLSPHTCIPESGSVAQLGPTGGSMLMFELSLSITENRPLALEIEGGGEKAEVELDL
jgi:hypothetical protein